MKKMSPTNSKSLNKMKFEFKKNAHILEYLEKVEECRADPSKYADADDETDEDTDDDDDDDETDDDDDDDDTDGAADDGGRRHV